MSSQRLSGQDCASGYAHMVVEARILRLWWWLIGDGGTCSGTGSMDCEGSGCHSVIKDLSLSPVSSEGEIIVRVGCFCFVWTWIWVCPELIL